MCTITTLSLNVSFHTFICRKHSPIGMDKCFTSSSFKCPAAFYYFWLVLEAIKNIAELTLILALVLNSAVVGWLLTLTLYIINFIHIHILYVYSFRVGVQQHAQLLCLFLGLITRVVIFLIFKIYLVYTILTLFFFAPNFNMF